MTQPRQKEKLSLVGGGAGLQHKKSSLLTRNNSQPVLELYSGGALAVGMIPGGSGLTPRRTGLI